MDAALVDRLDRMEADLRALRADVDEIRQGTSSAAPVPAAQPESPAELLRLAWLALERGREASALELASAALDGATVSGDTSVREDVAAFAAVAQETVLGPSLREQVDALAGRVRPRPPAPAPLSRPVEAPVPPPAAQPSAAARLASYTASELSEGRAFALAGGVVTLLGIVFLFVLAANRGWIGPVARVSIGALASLAVFAAGVMLRMRYGRLQASLAAAGTGIAGGYATLAAATIIYGFLPSWGALLLAAVIAATGSALALRWHSELLAGLSLVGAAAAPGLVALDDGIGAGGTAFAVVVLAASLFAAAPRRWLWLGASVCAVALAQVVWLTGASAADDAGAIAVVAGTALVLLVGAIAWQARSTLAGLTLFAGALALGSGGLLLGGLPVLLPVDRNAGLALAAAAFAYATIGWATWRRWRDLGTVVVGVALLLAGVATAFVLSGRSLTVVLAVEAAVLAALAWRLAMPRFELASLTYLAIGLAHAVAIDVPAGRPPGDLPSSASAGLFALAAAALLAGTFAVGERRDEQSIGILAPLEPLWNGFVANRGAIRMGLYALAVGLGACGLAAVLSARWLTLAWLTAAALLAIGAFILGEHRMQGAGLLLLGVAGVHALAVEAPPSTLALARGIDPLDAFPSLVALAAVTAAFGAFAVFSQRGIPFLGPLEGPERALTWLDTESRMLRGALFAASAWLAVWAAGLLVIRVSYVPGQVAATGLWAVTGVASAALAARRRCLPLALAAAAPTVFAFGKAASFDWDHLADGWAAAALLLAAAGVLLFGFFVRFAAAEGLSPVELVSIACATVADVSALIAVDRVAPDHMRVLGAAAAIVAVAVGMLSMPPFRAWKHGRTEPWLRNFATGYWALALITVGFAEYGLVLGSWAPTVALWAVTASGVAAAVGPLGEVRLWLAAGAGSFVAAGACLVAVTVPSRLVSSSAHPGAGLWALAACIGALGVVAWLAPPAVGRARIWVLVAAVVLAVLGLSLAVLEIAERVSSASVETDFQRGHTAVSALWGALALGLFVVGIVRNSRFAQRIGLALFGLALAKLFLYDLRSLSSITRAFSFIMVGAILLTAAFFTERILHGGDRAGPHAA